jgi:hypothetical protein
MRKHQPIMRTRGTAMRTAIRPRSDVRLRVSQTIVKTTIRPVTNIRGRVVRF